MKKTARNSTVGKDKADKLDEIWNLPKIDERINRGVIKFYDSLKYLTNQKFMCLNFPQSSRRCQNVDLRET